MKELKFQFLFLKGTEHVATLATKERETCNVEWKDDDGKVWFRNCEYSEIRPVVFQARKEKLNVFRALLLGIIMIYLFVVVTIIIIFSLEVIDNYQNNESIKYVVCEPKSIWSWYYGSTECVYTYTTMWRVFYYFYIF
jgi:hypothetical protein